MQTHQERRNETQRRRRKAAPAKTRAERRAYYYKHRERLLAAMRARYHANPQRHAAKAEEWKRKNRAKLAELAVAAKRLKNGFTPEVYSARMAEQGGRCAICGIQMTTGRGPAGAHADHWHDGRGPRGVLCRQCNWVLGRVKDDHAILVKAVAYLKRWERDAAQRRPTT